MYASRYSRLLDFDHLHLFASAFYKMVFSQRPGVLALIATQLFTLLSPVLASTDSISNPVKRIGVIGSAVKDSIVKRDGEGYTDPAAGGGSMLTVWSPLISISSRTDALGQIVNGTYPAGLGEPLNVILSGDSDDEVLAKSLDDGGFLNYML